MIREDRELLTELARLNREMVPLAMRMMEGSASVTEQQKYAERLIVIGERLRQRAVLTNEPLTLPGFTVESRRES